MILYGLRSFFTESRAECLPARSRMISFDVDMFRTAAVIRIVHTLHCLTVDADMLARMRHGTRKAVTAPLVKTFTTCIFTVAGMLSAHHDIALAAAVVFVVGTIAYSTG